MSLKETKINSNKYANLVREINTINQNLEKEICKKKIFLQISLLDEKLQSSEIKRYIYSIKQNNISDILKIKTYETNELFLTGNHEEIQFFDLRKKDEAMKLDNSRLKLENFLQIENRDKGHYLSGIDTINNRTLIYDVR